MKVSVTQQLNRLNHEFYAKTATAFDATRQQPWPGWIQSLPIFTRVLAQPKATCLDVGCGNGRLAVYLIKELQKIDWKYVGVDSSKELLEKAAQSVKTAGMDASFIELDIVEALLTSDSLQLPLKPELITLFGVLHHIPSYELRLKLLTTLRQNSSQNTTLLVTTWQFIEDANLMNRKAKPESIGIDAQELEENDYILTWERDVSAHRYCHYTSDTELQKLAQESGWGIDSTFVADGKSNTLNHYFVLTPR